MELKLNRETVPAAEMIYDGIQEQPLELKDFLLDLTGSFFLMVSQ